MIKELFENKYRKVKIGGIEQEIWSPDRSLSTPRKRMKVILWVVVILFTLWVLALEVTAYQLSIAQALPQWHYLTKN